MGCGVGYRHGNLCRVAEPLRSDWCPHRAAVVRCAKRQFGCAHPRCQPPPHRRLPLPVSLHCAVQGPNRSDNGRSRRRKCANGGAVIGASSQAHFSAFTWMNLAAVEDLFKLNINVFELSTYYEDVISKR